MREQVEKLKGETFNCPHSEWRKCPQGKSICCAFCKVVAEYIRDCPKACICASENREGFNCEVMPVEYKLRVMSYIAYVNHQGLAWLSNVLKELQKKYDVVMNLIRKIAKASEKWRKEKVKR